MKIHFGYLPALKLNKQKNHKIVYKYSNYYNFEQNLIYNL